MNTLEKENELVKRASALMDDFVAISQGKSDFVLQSFVVNQHDTTPARKKQALLELQIRMFNIRRTQLQADKLRAEIELRAEQSKGSTSPARKKIYELEKQELELSAEELDLARIGQLQEAETLYKIAMSYPAYTHEDYQADEVEYWTKRLARQVLLDLNNHGAPGVGNVDAIRMMAASASPELKGLAEYIQDPIKSLRGPDALPR